MTSKYVKFNKDQSKLCLWEEWVDVQTQGGKDKGPYFVTRSNKIRSSKT